VVKGLAGDEFIKSLLIKTLKNKTNKMAFNKASETVLNPHNNITWDGFAFIRLWRTTKFYQPADRQVCKWERSGHPDTVDECGKVNINIFFAHFQTCLPECYFYNRV